MASNYEREARGKSGGISVPLGWELRPGDRIRVSRQAFPGSDTWSYAIGRTLSYVPTTGIASIKEVHKAGLHTVLVVMLNGREYAYKVLSDTPAPLA